TEEQAALALKSQKALRVYKKSLLQRRIRTLEKALVITFNEICRKERLLSEAHIDPTSFSITLHGADGHKLRIGSLSAGERQLYALALLKALRIISGRQLPLIVDTPLARLDTIHRPNVVQQYFPSVSDQVILFGTEVELSKTVMEQVQPHLARAYELSYNLDEAETDVRLTHVAAGVSRNETELLDESVFS
ncbi:hypothetical protein MJD09_26620, partial [bacterium]|nr:hypothetical protein [bacterium]